MSHIPIRTVILGAGPAGLAYAHRLLARGDDSFVLFEKEAAAGGLCRSQEVDGAPLDIGGGHFLDTRRPKANQFLFQFLPEDEWNRYTRKSTILVRGYEIDYPFEANLWQFPVALQLDYLESIAKSGCLAGAPMPESFRAWVTWKLGERIAHDYMLPYNEKIWGLENLDELGVYWLHKLPAVSFRDTLRSCLEKRCVGKLPGHATFLYPRSGGYGRVWRIMGERLGRRLLTGRAPREIDVAGLTVDEFSAERLVTTIPWPEFVRVARGVPEGIRAAIEGLRHTGIKIGYRRENWPSSAHWTYVPDVSVPHHRLLLRHNFCPGSHGYWTETHSQRAEAMPAAAPPPVWRHVNAYAYPLNTTDKPQRMRTLCEWCRETGLVALGRWGEWEHVNSDVAVETALAQADEATGRSLQSWNHG